MKHVTQSFASPRSTPALGIAGGIARGLAACARPSAVVMQGNALIAKLGHETSDNGHNTQSKQGVIWGGLSM
jgi:hypothetical protein